MNRPRPYSSERDAHDGGLLNFVWSLFSRTSRFPIAHENRLTSPPMTESDDDRIMAERMPEWRRSIQTRGLAFSNRTFPQFILHYAGSSAGNSAWHSARKPVFSRESASLIRRLNPTLVHDGRKSEICCLFATRRVPTLPCPARLNGPFQRKAFPALIA